MMVCAECLGKFDVIPIHGAIATDGSGITGFWREGSLPVPFLCPKCARKFPTVYQYQAPAPATRHAP